MDISQRGLRALNLEQYSSVNLPEKVGKLDTICVCPYDIQYVLRCLVKTTFGEVILPDFLEWMRPLLTQSIEYQRKMGIRQPFCYITVRHGEVISKTDDEWHVDGFSQTITHLPEQNYIYSNVNPTEYIEKSFNFPNDFDYNKHNIHLFFQDNIDLNNGVDNIKVMEAETLYCIDPYIVHKRPKVDSSVNRTFIRISFTPIEIDDINNTKNPLLETNYTRDGIKDFREKLIRY